MKIAARHDAILRSLRRRGLTTVDALASETGCSRRTIIRDIGALREQGFVIQSDPGRGGGLQLDPGSVQLTARLSVAEVFALLLCVATIRAGGTLPFSALADSGLARIERSLPPDRLRDLRRLLDCLHVGTLSPLQDLSDLGPVDPALLPARVEPGSTDFANHFVVSGQQTECRSISLRRSAFRRIELIL